MFYSIFFNIILTVIFFFKIKLGAPGTFDENMKQNYFGVHTNKCKVTEKCLERDKRYNFRRALKQKGLMLCDAHKFI